MKIAQAGRAKAPQKGKKEMTNYNRIPRRFSRIVGESKTETSHTQPGDILHIYRNNNGLLALNTRTGKYAYIFPAMVRNPEIFKITEVIQ